VLRTRSCISRICGSRKRQPKLILTRITFHATFDRFKDVLAEDNCRRSSIFGSLAVGIRLLQN